MLRKFLYAEFTALPGQEQRVGELITELAHRVRAEPGNLAFDVHHKAEDPAAFFVYEVYRDQAAFDTHLAAAYGETFNREIADLIVEGTTRLTMLSHL
jgi:quinol monooxygenase YgiN